MCSRPHQWLWRRRARPRLVVARRAAVTSAAHLVTGAHRPSLVPMLPAPLLLALVAAVLLLLPLRPLSRRAPSPPRALPARCLRLLLPDHRLPWPGNECPLGASS